MKPDWGQQQERMRKQQEELMRRQQEQMRRQQQDQVKQQQDLLHRQQAAYYQQQKQAQKGENQAIQPGGLNQIPLPNPQLASRFLQVENQVSELRQQLAAGKLSIDQVQQKLLSLAVRDDNGVWWSMGFQSGEWYRFEANQWIKVGVPPDLLSIKTSGSGKGRKSRH